MAAIECGRVRTHDLWQMVAALSRWWNLICTSSSVYRNRTNFEQVWRPQMRILFADDTQDTREMFHLALEMAGHSLCMVGNGADAVQAARAERFDVIVMD